jgi:hypothetical protein
LKKFAQSKMPQIPAVMIKAGIKLNTHRMPGEPMTINRHVQRLSFAKATTPLPKRMALKLQNSKSEIVAYQDTQSSRKGPPNERNPSMWCAGASSSPGLRLQTGEV